MWIVEIGRRLLAAPRDERRVEATTDVAEHRAIAAAIAARDGDRAAALMAAHIGEALQHWEHEPHD